MLFFLLVLSFCLGQDTTQMTQAPIPPAMEPETTPGASSSGGGTINLGLSGGGSIFGGGGSGLGLGGGSGSSSGFNLGLGGGGGGLGGFSLEKPTTHPLLRPFELHFDGLGNLSLVTLDLTDPAAFYRYFTIVDPHQTGVELLEQYGFKSKNPEMADVVLGRVKSYQKCTEKEIEKNVVQRIPDPPADQLFSFAENAPSVEEKPSFGNLFDAGSNFVDLHIRLCHALSKAHVEHRYFCQSQDGHQPALCQQEVDWSWRAIESIVRNKTKVLSEDLKRQIRFGFISSTSQSQLWQSVAERRAEVRALKLARVYDMPIAEPLSVRPERNWIAALVVFGLMWIATVFVAIMSFVKRFLTCDQRALIALIALLFVAVSLQVVMWSFAQVLRVAAWAGHQGHLDQVSVYVEDIMRRVSIIAYLLVFVVFAFILFRASAETYSKHRAKLWTMVAALVLFSATFIASSYSIAMGVVNTQATTYYIMDVSFIVTAGVMFAVSLALAIVFGVVWRSVGAKQSRRLSRGNQMLRNASILFAGAIVISLLFLASFILSLVVLFYDMAYTNALRITEAVSFALLTVAILAYFTAGIVANMSRKPIVVSPEAEGYALWDSSQGIVPQQYQDF